MIVAFVFTSSLPARARATATATAPFKIKVGVARSTRFQVVGDGEVTVNNDRQHKIWISKANNGVYISGTISFT